MPPHNHNIAAYLHTACRNARMRPQEHHNKAAYLHTTCCNASMAPKCASRHGGVHFFNSSSSKGAPSMVCFYYFGFELCFAPQRRALLEQLYFQKCSGMLRPWVVLIFLLSNVLRASMHFFDISTWLRCFDRFYFQICLAPQRHAIFDLSSDQIAPHPPL